jgi:hypothetical protein
MSFDRVKLKELRNIVRSVRERYGLDPVSERYDLAFTMDRWVQRALNDLNPRNADQPPIAKIENIDELIAKLTVPGPSRRQYRKKQESTRKRRPRADFERDLALALAVIFHEYTGTKPTRISKNYEVAHDTFDRDKTSPFYRFATASFNAIGLKPKEITFREATERWERSRGFQKKSFQRLLWGGLHHDGNEGPPDLTWQEKRLTRRKKSPRD